MTTRDLAGVEVACLTLAEAVQRLEAAVRADGLVKVAFANAHLINLAAADLSLRAALSGFLVLPDGVGVDLGSKLLFGATFPANLNGTDFVPAFLAGVERPLAVMLLGGRPGVAEAAAERLAQAHPAHRFDVLHHGFFGPADEAPLLARLRAARPDLLLVALGNPRQEAWIASRLDARHCAVAAGVGALFDFLSGTVPRAPSLLRGLRLEWAYRLSLEPERLWRRYLVGNPLFLWRMARLAWTRRRVRTRPLPPWPRAT